MKKGLTLVEIIISITLLVIIGTIGVFGYLKHSDSLEIEQANYYNIVKNSSLVFFDVNIKNDSNSFDNFNNFDYSYITLGDLVYNGLLDENIYNPYTGNKTKQDMNEYVKIYKTTGEESIYNVSYPVDYYDVEINYTCDEILYYSDYESNGNLMMEMDNCYNVYSSLDILDYSSSSLKYCGEDNDCDTDDDNVNIFSYQYLMENTFFEEGFYEFIIHVHDLNEGYFEKKEKIYIYADSSFFYNGPTDAHKLTYDDIVSHIEFDDSYFSTKFYFCKNNINSLLGIDISEMFYDEIYNRFNLVNSGAFSSFSELCIGSEESFSVENSLLQKDFVDNDFIPYGNYYLYLEACRDFKFLGNKCYKKFYPIDINGESIEMLDVALTDNKVLVEYNIEHDEMLTLWMEYRLVDYDNDGGVVGYKLDCSGDDYIISEEYIHSFSNQLILLSQYYNPVSEVANFMWENCYHDSKSTLSFYFVDDIGQRSRYDYNLNWQNYEDEFDDEFDDELGEYEGCHGLQCVADDLENCLTNGCSSEQLEDYAGAASEYGGQLEYGDNPYITDSQGNIYY